MAQDYQVQPEYYSYFLIAMSKCAALMNTIVKTVIIAYHREWAYDETAAGPSQHNNLPGDGLKFDMVKLEEV